MVTIFLILGIIALVCTIAAQQHLYGIGYKSLDTLLSMSLALSNTFRALVIAGITVKNVPSSARTCGLYHSKCYVNRRLANSGTPVTA